MITAVMFAMLLQAAPADEFKLKFKQNIPPEVEMDLENATVVEFEVPLRQDQVSTAKGRGKTLGDWLVARGVCPDTDASCTFTVRFAGYVGTNAKTKKIEVFARYVVRSDAGHTAEGFSRATLADQQHRAYWVQKNGFWVGVHDETDIDREYRFLFMLLQLAKTGAGQHPAAPAQKPSAPAVSRVVVT